MSLLAQYAQRFDLQSVPLQTFFTQADPMQAPGVVPWIPGVEQTALRIAQALLHNQKVCIYSDYDTDAVTATGVMYWGLRDLGIRPENLTFYAPDRFTEGYGMNPDAVAALAQQNNLIISVDCGINSTTEAGIVQTHPDCDLIITDHHHLHGNLPHAMAVVNPRLTAFFAENIQKNAHQNSTPHPWVLYPQVPAAVAQKCGEENIHRYLSRWQTYAHSVLTQPDAHSPYAVAADTVTGVGVAWLAVLHCALFLAEMNLISPQTIAKIARTLPLVAIGTVADCQSVLEPLNRIFVRAGLSIAQKNQHGMLGLAELLTQTGLQEKMNQGYQLTSQDCAFTLSPILNSSGRLTHAQLSIQTLVAAKQTEAKHKAAELIQTNEERKAYVKSIVGDLITKADAEIDRTDSTMIWLEGDWSKGIIGLIASRLVSTWGVPTIIVSTQDPDHATASLRAPEGIHLPQAMQSAGEDLFEKFGGHPGAAGFSASYAQLGKIKAGMEDNLYQQLENYTPPKHSFFPAEWKNITPARIYANHHNDPSIIWLTATEVTQEMLQSVWQLDPFGIDFPLPQFAFYLDKGSFRWLGKEFKHIKITNSDGLAVTTFNISSSVRDFFVRQDSFQFSSRIWCIAKPSQNSWNGKTSMQLIADVIEVER